MKPVNWAGSPASTDKQRAAGAQFDDRAPPRWVALEADLPFQPCRALANIAQARPRRHTLRIEAATVIYDPYRKSVPIGDANGHGARSCVADGIRYRLVEQAETVERIAWRRIAVG